MLSPFQFSRTLRGNPIYSKIHISNPRPPNPCDSWFCNYQITILSKAPLDTPYNMTYQKEEEEEVFVCFLANPLRLRATKITCVVTAKVI